MQSICQRTKSLHKHQSTQKEHGTAEIKQSSIRLAQNLCLYCLFISQ